jgi:hypothetical protein
MAKFTVGDEVCIKIQPEVVGTIADIKDDGWVEFSRSHTTVIDAEGGQTVEQYLDEEETFPMHEKSLKFV